MTRRSSPGKMSRQRTSGGSRIIAVTVTFLEMTAPPRALPPLPVHRQVALLKTRNMPLHFYRYLMDRVGRKWHWVNALRISDEELADGLDIPAATSACSISTARRPASSTSSRICRETVELAYFGMMEHAMGQGIGRWFLGAAIDAAWSTGPSVVTVQTCTLDHPAALPLYQKLGFSPVGQKREMVQPMSFEERSASVMRP